MFWKIDTIALLCSRVANKHTLKCLGENFGFGGEVILNKGHNQRHEVEEEKYRNQGGGGEGELHCLMETREGS